MSDDTSGDWVDTDLIEIRDQSPDLTSDEVREDLQQGHRDAVGLKVALAGEADRLGRLDRLRARIDDLEVNVDVEDVQDVAKTALSTAVAVLHRIGLVTAAAYPLALSWTLVTLIWAVHGLSYFETTIWSWESAVALYGSYTVLYLAHRTLDDRVASYRAIRYTGGLR